MKQIYCEEGALCSRCPLEKRKIIKRGMNQIITLLFLSVFLPIFFSGAIRKAVAVEYSLFFEVSIFLGWVIMVILFSVIYQVFYYRFYFYDINDKEIIIRKGVIARNEIILSFSKIQSIYVNQDFWDRIFGLYDVHIETAGWWSGFQAHIDGVNAKNSEVLKQILIEKARTGKIESTGL